MAPKRQYKRHVVVGGYGSPPLHLTLEMVQAMKRMKVEGTLLKVTAHDFNVSTRRPALEKASPKGVYHKPRKPKGRQDAGEYTYGMEGSDEVALQRKGVWGPEVDRGNDGIQQAANRHNVINPQTFWFAGWSGGHILINEEALRLRHRILEEENIVLVLILPHQTNRRERIRLRADLPFQLKRQGIVATTLLLDDLSGLVVRYPEQDEDPTERGRGLVAMDARVGNALAGFVAAPWHFGSNTAPVDVIRALKSVGTMTAMSFGSRHLPELDVDLITWINEKFFGYTPEWTVKDLVDAARIAAQDALEIREGSRTIEAEPLPARGTVQWHLLMTVPLPVDDRRWRDLQTQFKNWIESPQQRHRYGNVTPVWASGPGAPEFGRESAGFQNIQASVWYPLRQQRVVEPVQEILDRPDERDLRDQEEQELADVELEEALRMARVERALRIEAEEKARREELEAREEAVERRLQEEENDEKEGGN